MERVIKRDLSSLEQIEMMLEEFSSEHGLSQADRFSLSLAIEEVVTNIIRHQPKTDVGIRLRLNGSAARVIVTIVDPESVFFDPTVARDPKVDLPIEQRKPGGLGIFLTKKVMDEVRYEFENGTGTTTLVKRLES
jgi:anti-sigma regulatory factor (Ser/Thr protein kinase)